VHWPGSLWTRRPLSRPIPRALPSSARRRAEDFNIDRLQRPPHEGIVPDLFALAAPAPAAPAAPPPPPKPVIPVETVKAPSPPPTAPPFPYTYVGGMQQEGVRRIFLAKGDDAYTVSEGDTLEGNYRITSITPERVTLTYLPLNIEQTVDLSVQDSK
jgi:hypothetical protein